MKRINELVQQIKFFKSTGAYTKIEKMYIIKPTEKNNLTRRAISLDEDDRLNLLSELIEEEFVEELDTNVFRFKKNIVDKHYDIEESMKAVIKKKYGENVDFENLYIKIKIKELSSGDFMTIFSIHFEKMV